MVFGVGGGEPLELMSRNFVYNVQVYVVYFKTNKKFLNQYDNIREYVKEIYQMPEVKKSINMKHIKEHYFGSHPTLNTYSIVPVGPGPWYEEPHNRGK